MVFYLQKKSVGVQFRAVAKEDFERNVDSDLSANRFKNSKMILLE